MAKRLPKPCCSSTVVVAPANLRTRLLFGDRSVMPSITQGLNDDDLIAKTQLRDSHHQNLPPKFTTKIHHQNSMQDSIQDSNFQMIESQ
jgi:hypothetical protein